MQGLVDFYPELYESNGEGGILQANFGKKWGTYQTIIELSGGDIQQIQNVVKLPLETCLLYLAYKSDKILMENMLHEQSMKTIK